MRSFHGIFAKNYERKFVKFPHYATRCFSVEICNFAKIFTTWLQRTEYRELNSGYNESYSLVGSIYRFLRSPIIIISGQIWRRRCRRLRCWRCLCWSWWSWGWRTGHSLFFNTVYPILRHRTNRKPFKCRTQRGCIGPRSSDSFRVFFHFPTSSTTLTLFIQQTLLFVLLT